MVVKTLYKKWAQDPKYATKWDLNYVPNLLTIMSVNYKTP